LEFFL